MTPRTIGLLLGLGAVALWGLSFVATRVALQELTPMAVVLGRTGLGVLGLLVVMAIRGQRWAIPRSIWPMLFVVGGLGVFLHQLLHVYGLSLTTAIRTGWLIGIIPKWSALLALLFLGERLGALRAVGLLVGLGGVMVLLTGGQAGSVLQLPQTRGG